jgi:DNA-directed RNA polymerase specialized sigma24 family protein
MKAGRAQGEAATGFERLLARLDPDPRRAEEEFARFRRALTRYFDWRGAPWPEDAADETLDRLARKLEEGVAVLDLHAFARGIAKLVLQETLRSRERLTPIDDLEARGDSPAAPERVPEAPLAAHLDRCLEALERSARELVLAYYAGGDGRTKIESRQRLARTYRLTDNALRSRVQRLRDQLEACVRLRSASGDGGGR